MFVDSKGKVMALGFSNSRPRNVGDAGYILRASFKVNYLLPPRPSVEKSIAS